MRAILYLLEGCPHCAAVRARLDRDGVAYEAIDVAERPEAIPELLKLTRGRRIVPVLVGGGRIEVAPEGGTPF